MVRVRSLCLSLASLFILSLDAQGDEKAPCVGPECVAGVDEYFSGEVWAKVGAQFCVNCHKAGGDAEETQFILQDPKRSQGAAQLEALRHNRDAFARFAQLAANSNPCHPRGCVMTSIRYGWLRFTDARPRLSSFDILGVPRRDRGQVKGEVINGRRDVFHGYAGASSKSATSRCPALSQVGIAIRNEPVAVSYSHNKAC